jgi:hypothetical protein
MVSLNVNGLSVEASATPDTPLLWVLRDDLGLTGTKFGCGIAQCGACTVHLDGRPVRSCVLPIGLVKGRAVTTIEAIGQTQACRGRGSTSMSCNAAIVSPARSWRRRRCWPGTRIPTMPRSMPPWPATSVDAGPIRGFAMRSKRRRHEPPQGERQSAQRPQGRRSRRRLLAGRCEGRLCARPGS